MKTEPCDMPWKAPSVPTAISLRSLSLPTQAKTKSAPSAAWRGVDTARPPNCATQRSAFSPVRLYTVSSWPPRVLRCPAIGNPMTPRPIQAARNTMSMLQFLLSQTAELGKVRQCYTNSAMTKAGGGNGRDHRRHSPGERTAQGQCGADPPPPRPEALRADRRRDLGQVREPASHQLLQGPGRLCEASFPDPGRTGPRCHRHVGRQS